MKKNGLRGLRNLFRVYFEIKKQSQKVKSEPTNLQIESTNVCNLKCVMCKRTYWKKEKIGSISFKNFIKVVNQFKYINNLCLNGLGEPFFNKDIFRMIKYAKEKMKVGCVWFDSNGTTVDERFAREIIDSGLDRIGFSLDGATKETYEKIRPGANFETVVKNIKNLVELRNESGKKNPHTMIAFTTMKENVSELIKIVELAHSTGVDGICIQIINPDFPGEGKMKFEMPLEQLKKAKEMADRFGIEFSYTSYFTCVFPWLRPYITWNGYVTPCCNKPDPEEISFGNVFNEPFEKIWNNEKYQEFRKRLNSDNPPDVCKECPLRFRHIKRIKI